MIDGLLGKKLGMTQVFDAANRIIPVTLILAGPCVILSRKTMEKNGYDSVQLGFGSVPERSASKPTMGQLKKINAKPARFIKEIRGSFDDDVGATVTLEIFKEGGYIDVTAVSKGKGFAGGMKRWGWAGGGASHGSMSHRRVGAIGCRTTPGRIFKGKTMPGRMGNENITVQNLKIVSLNKDKSILAVKGAVPGVNNGFVIIKQSVKKKGLK